MRSARRWDFLWQRLSKLQAYPLSLCLSAIASQKSVVGSDRQRPFGPHCKCRPGDKKEVPLSSSWFGAQRRYCLWAESGGAVINMLRLRAKGIW
jgi:hypothetical protein